MNALTVDKRGNIIAGYIDPGHDYDFVLISFSNPTLSSTGINNVQACFIGVPQAIVYSYSTDKLVIGAKTDSNSGM